MGSRYVLEEIEHAWVVQELLQPGRFGQLVFRQAGLSVDRRRTGLLDLGLSSSTFRSSYGLLLGGLCCRCLSSRPLGRRGSLTISISLLRRRFPGLCRKLLRCFYALGAGTLVISQRRSVDLVLLLLFAGQDEQGAGSSYRRTGRLR